MRSSEFRFIEFDGEWTGHTWHSGEAWIEDGDVIYELEQVAAMYHDLAAQYERRAALAERYDIAASYRRVKAAREAAERTGLVGVALATLHSEDEEIAAAFGWPLP